MHFGVGREQNDRQVGNRCLVWQATASASIPSCLYSSTTAGHRRFTVDVESQRPARRMGANRLQLGKW